MSETQTYKNHTRRFPPFHFFVLPVLFLDFFIAIGETIHHWPEHRFLFLWWIVLSMALIALAVCSRVMALRAQDRLIRLEERLRFVSLLPADLLARSQTLTIQQYVALRFCSDQELPALLKRTLDETLDPKQIKAAIVTWKPDDYRV